MNALVVVLEIFSISVLVLIFASVLLDCWQSCSRKNDGKRPPGWIGE